MKYEIKNRTPIATKLIVANEIIDKFELNDKNSISAKVDMNCRIYTTPLILKLYHLLKSNSQSVEYFNFPTYDTYKKTCPMYMSYTQLRQLPIHTNVVVNQCMLIIDELLNMKERYSIDDFQLFLYSYHIVNTRVFLDNNTQTVYLIKNIDMLNNSVKRQNTTYYFKHHSFYLKATKRINKGEELFDIYELPPQHREKIFIHYYYIDTDLVSEDTDEPLLKTIHNEAISLLELFN
jgi:hypothetical protein